MDQDVVEALIDAEGSWWSEGRKELVHRLAVDQGFLPGGLTVDVGCGVGDMVDFFARFGPAIGFDPELNAVLEGQRRGRTLAVATAESIPVDDGSASLVLALDVLEHIEDDIGAVREIFRLCRPGGLFVASVPAYPFLWSPYDESARHVRRYSKRQFLTLINAAGFNVQRMTGYNAVFLPLVAPVRVLSRSRLARKQLSLDTASQIRTSTRLSVIGRGATAIERSITKRGIDIPIGLSLVVVARRPLTRQSSLPRP